MDNAPLSEYPALLDNLQPSQAVSTLNDRLKRISKLNIEIADWLQERRKAEELYVQSLKKLGQIKLPNVQSELGTFQPQWDKILTSTESLAHAHQIFASKLGNDIETSLRNFQSVKEIGNMNKFSTNLANMARERDDAQEKSDKLNKKAGKASAAKIDTAASNLEAATDQWESQAPFIFENLQALDEKRMNHLRDVLTQYGTLESEVAQQHQTMAEGVLNSLLDYDTAAEIKSFANRTKMGKPRLEKRVSAPPSRQSSTVGAPSSSMPPPPSRSESRSEVAPPPSIPEDRMSESSGPREKEPPQENRLRSRIGTMLGRRRQSVHGGFGALSPSKGPFGRSIKSSHGVSPRASSSNLAEASRLSSLAERPDGGEELASPKEQPEHDGTNGFGTETILESPTATSPSHVNGDIPAEIAAVPPPPGPPPSQKEPEKDAEGFTIPSSMIDPITAAQLEAGGEDAEHAFKLNIQSEPVADEDPEAKKAALSNVANSLFAMGGASRRTSTIRGRRDQRASIYLNAPVSEDSIAAATSSNSMPGYPPSPALPTSLSNASKPAAPAAVALASEASIAGTSDTQSIRSATSLGGGAQPKHPEMHSPGLNSSIVETISATFEGDKIQSVKVAGEIAFSYNAADAFVAPGQQTIRINNISSIEAPSPNRIFVSQASQPDQFTLDLSHIAKTTVGFSYRLPSDPDAPPSTASLPILLNPAWKPQGDKLGLLIQYKANPEFKFASSGPVALHNLIISASYEGKASGAQTKPSGTHLKDRHVVYWRLGDVTLTPGGSWTKLVCRIVGEQNAEPTAGVIEARWEHLVSSPTDSDDLVSISRLEQGKGKEPEADPFADQTAEQAGKWVDVPAIRRLVSGKYESK